MPVTYNKPNRYDFVGRKVFDRQVDRLERKIAQVGQELRDLELHVAEHCDTLEKLNSVLTQEKKKP